MSSKKRFIAVCLVLVALALAWLFFTGEREESLEPMTVRGLDLQGLTVTTHAGEPLPMAFGTVDVPEVRSKAESRTIHVGFGIVPALPGAGDTPIFVVAGGPGGSYTRGLDRVWLQDLI
ncbi:MAG: hypothetical protein AAFX50_11100, partial [Acidobacteriota bacterium]